MSSLPKPPEPPEVLLEFGGALRELQSFMLQMPAEEGPAEDALREAAGHVRSAIAALQGSGQLPEAGSREAPDQRPRYGMGPMSSPHNPVFPKPQVDHVNGATQGRIHFDIPFEGPPGCVHGGFVAAFFDQVLGQHNMANGADGMTARLVIQYRRPTPLDRELRFEVEGGRTAPRKTTTRGRIFDEHGTLAEAEGFFIIPRSGMPLRRGS